MIAILCLVAGIALRANDHLFNGADTVGLVLAIYGGLGVAIQAVLILLVSLGVIVAASDGSRKYRRF